VAGGVRSGDYRCVDDTTELAQPLREAGKRKMIKCGVEPKKKPPKELRA